MKYLFSMLSALVLLSCGGCSTQEPRTDSANVQKKALPRRSLTVSLYPYVPDAERMFADAKLAFEKRHPDVEVISIPLTDYYNSSKPNSLKNAMANVIEVDSVFLADLIKDKKLVPLSADASPNPGEFVSAAIQVAQQDNDVWIGVPHWVCSNFVYSTKEKPFAGKTLADLEKFIGVPHTDGTGLLVDMMGKSTIGELYLDALVDEAGSLSSALPLLLPGAASTYANAAKSDLQRLLGLCDKQFCRDGAHHDETGSYAREFALRRGSAFIGYSEQTYFMLKTLSSPACAAGNCLSEKDVVVSTAPMANTAAQSFVWVDVLAINNSCKDECVADATSFIQMMNDDDHLKGDLFSTPDSPRYLLPAKTTLDTELSKRAPLYATFRKLTHGAPPAIGSDLGDRLRTIGAALDTDPALTH